MLKSYIKFWYYKITFDEHLIDVSRKESVKYKDINIPCIHYGEHNNTKTQRIRQRIDCKFEIRFNLSKS